MAELDILNPVTGHWAQINDNPNPSYGFTRKTNVNSQLARARLGSWYQRDNANDGYAFALTYVNRPWTTMLRLKQFYEIGKSGYFTLIDYDGGGRNHVGRFTTEPNPIQVANGKYTVMNLIFEEIPQARMLSYPSDFVNWARTINVIDDFLNPAVASQGNWTVQPTPAFAALGPPTNPVTGLASQPLPYTYELLCTSANASDFAQVQYVGFGFQMSLRLNVGFGTWDIVVDGQTLVTQLNLTNGVAKATVGYTPVNSVFPLAPPTVTPNIFGALNSTVTVQIPQMPLDIHRVKIVRNLAMAFTQPNPTIGVPIAGAGIPNFPTYGGFIDLGLLPAAFPAMTVIV